MRNKWTVYHSFIVPKQVGGAINRNTKIVQCESQIHDLLFCCLCCHKFRSISCGFYSWLLFCVPFYWSLIFQVKYTCACSTSGDIMVRFASTKDVSTTSLPNGSGQSLVFLLSLYHAQMSPSHIWAQEHGTEMNVSMSHLGYVCNNLLDII